MGVLFTVQLLDTFFEVFCNKSESLAPSQPSPGPPVGTYVQDEPPALAVED